MLAQFVGAGHHGSAQFSSKPCQCEWGIRQAPGQTDRQTNKMDTCKQANRRNRLISTGLLLSGTVVVCALTWMCCPMNRLTWKSVAVAGQL